MFNKLLVIVFIIIAVLSGAFFWQHKKTDTENKQSSISTSFNKKLYSVDNPDSIWVIVNKKRPLNPINYEPTDLTEVTNGQQMRKEAANALQKLINDAQSQGLELIPASSYRSYQTQVIAYDSEVKNYGQATADTESARPGYSEHQTGLAVDLSGGGCNIKDCFSNTKEGQWVSSHAYKYGFIVRYTTDKQAITGYRAEPWHIRFIGQDLAQEMHKTGYSTLEEPFKLPAAPNY